MKNQSSFPRRRFLKTAGAATATGLAGCSTFSEGPGIRIVEITLSNLDDAAHTVEITIKESDEVVLREQAELPPAEYSGGEVTAASWQRVSDLPEDPGAYVIEVTVDDGEASVFRTAELAESSGESGPGCVDLIAEAGRDGSAGIWYATTCAPLSETQNTDDA